MLRRTPVSLIIACKGITENRISRLFPKKTPKEIAEERDIKISKLKHPAPKNRKEELSHLTAGLSYEYVSDFQRTANDFMAMTNDPSLYSTDMAYQYQRISKCKTATRRYAETGDDCVNTIRVSAQ
jgi:hypothetical protein